MSLELHGGGLTWDMRLRNHAALPQQAGDPARRRPRPGWSCSQASADLRSRGLVPAGQAVGPRAAPGQCQWASGWAQASQSRGCCPPRRRLAARRASMGGTVSLMSLEQSGSGQTITRPSPPPPRRAAEARRLQAPCWWGGRVCIRPATTWPCPSTASDQAMDRSRTTPVGRPRVDVGARSGGSSSERQSSELGRRGCGHTAFGQRGFRTVLGGAARRPGTRRTPRKHEVSGDGAAVGQPGTAPARAGVAAGAGHGCAITRFRPGGGDRRGWGMASVRTDGTTAGREGVRLRSHRLWPARLAASSQDVARRPGDAVAARASTRPLRQPGDRPA